MQRVWRAALPACRPPALQLVPVMLLRRGDVLHRRLRRLRAGHMAVTALYGRHDRGRPHGPAHPGKTTFHSFLVVMTQSLAPCDATLMVSNQMKCTC